MIYLFNKKHLMMFAFALIAFVSAYAFDIPEMSDNAQALLIAKDAALQVLPSVDTYFFQLNETFSDPAVQAFMNQYGRQWDVFWDTRSDRPDLISGQGIPFIPGPGNNLKDFGIYGQPTNGLTLESLAESVLYFIEDNPDLLRVDLESLEMDPLATRGFGENNRLWFVHFKQVYKNLEVKNSRVFFRINSGNITQFGAHQFVDIPSDFDVTPAISMEKALNISIDHAMMVIDGDLDIVSPPELVIVPTFNEGRSGIVGEPYLGAPGEGYGVRLVWEMTFRLEPHIETWYSMVDAQTGEILHFQDDNKYGHVHGATFADNNIGSEEDKPFPFVQTDHGISTSGGRLDYSGSVTSTLNGQYVQISDNCGSISLTSPNGELDFGASPATDCSTPGFGGSGNTRTTRTAFYHINQIKMKAGGYLPNNNWIKGKLRANVNIRDTCNAYWDGSTINFYRSGGGCSNTGELAPVMMHEWGHGLDSNTGTSSTEMASAEALSDSMAMLQTHVSCVGHNFKPGVPCSFGCDASCTGVRDAGVRPHIKPSNMNVGPANCAQWSCPYSGYAGIMGYEGHCEALIAAGAVWDTATKLAAAKGDAGWAHINRIYFETMGDYQAAYRIVSGGQCNPNANIDGCGSLNWYTVWLFADDDNGNLADGTPNGCLIWDAFNDHGIACGTRPACHTTCPSLAAPNLVAAPGENQATLSWDAVSGASYYLIFRNTCGCDFERAIIGSTTSTQYVDNTVADDFTYYYSVQAVGANDSCKSSMSACLEVSPGLSSNGTISLDKAYYGNNDTIVIDLGDLDLFGAGTIAVTVKSNSEPAGETVVLAEIAAPSGIFSGSIMTTNTPGVSGKITIANGDLISAIYYDENTGQGSPAEKIATAHADLMPPIISNITATNIGANSFTITWNTNEPADSVLIYGNLLPPQQLVADAEMTTTHRLTATNLNPGTQYFFLVKNTDVAGNTATDDNGGAYYTVTTIHLLWDQPVSPSSPGRVANQEFPDYSSHTSFVADDFKNTETWFITEIFVPGELYNGGTSLMNATALHWYIYADNNGIPAGNPVGGGPHFWSLDLAPSSPQVTLSDGNSDVNLTLSAPIELPPGTWWLIVYPTMHFGNHGQWGRLSSNTSNLSIAKFINPGGGFSHGTSWQNWSVMGPSQHDAAFRLSGSLESVPTPTPVPTSTPGPPTPTQTDCINNGDANLDGRITSTDAQIAFRIALGQHSPTYQERCAADCNGDDKVTSQDAQLIFAAALGGAPCADPLY